MSRVRIAVAGDERYLPGAIGTLAGIRMALDSSVAMEVAFLHDGLPESQQKRVLQALEKLRGDSILRFIEIDSAFPEFPDFYFPSKLTYARLLLTSVLEWDRLIYIDVDFLVLRSLEPLYLSKTCETGLGAAVETVIQKISGDPPGTAVADAVDSDAAYFNAGLLVLDLEKIRNARLFDMASRILSAVPTACKFWDQSALNYAANGKFTVLKPDWNRQTHRAIFDPIEAIEALHQKKINIHFTSKSKPWIFWSPFPAERMFQMLLEAVDPGWSGPAFATSGTAFRRKLRFAGWLAPFFACRAVLRKSVSDRRTAEYWHRMALDLAALRSRRESCSRLLKDWKHEIAQKLR